MNTDQLMAKFKMVEKMVLWRNVHTHGHTESRPMFQFSKKTKDLFSFQCLLCLPKINHIIAFNISLKNNFVTFKQVLKLFQCSCRSVK